MSNQKYTTEFKKQVVEFYLDHHTVKETLSEFNIPESTLFVWKHQYQTHMFEKPCSTKSSSIKHMQRKLDRMKAVFEAQSILKCSPNASNAEKVKAVNRLLQGCFSVERIVGVHIEPPKISIHRFLYVRRFPAKRKSQGLTSLSFALYLDGDRKSESVMQDDRELFLTFHPYLSNQLTDYTIFEEGQVCARICDLLE